MPFFRCDECGKRFPTKKDLGRHRRTVHRKCTKDHRPWKCDLCDVFFTLESALLLHRESVHLHPKKHVCNICDKSFKSASSLRGHVRRHQGNGDYKCEVCEKEFFTYSELRTHKVKHQTARDFICGVCGKAFKEKKALAVIY